MTVIFRGKGKGSVDEDKEEERKEAEEEVSQDDDIGIEEERRKSYHRSPQYSRYREITKLTIKLIIHFLAVLVVLFGSAVVFAYLEDGEYLLADQSSKLNSSINRASISTSSKSTVNTSMLMPSKELFV